MQATVFIAILLVNLSSIYCTSSTICGSKASCDSCIGTYGCTWCKEISFVQHKRCNTFKGHESNKCASQHIVLPQPPNPQTTKNEPISKTMRITPQEILIPALAVGQEVKLDLTYRDITDKPLDLYYVMDLSATMENDKKTVSTQANALVKELKKITKDVRLGFGSFIDKPVLPFVASTQLRQDPSFEMPYGFRNWLKLTDDTSKFSNVVKNARISRNIDEPEGTLDALMQAITCTDEIGWRNSSRKLIVVATDGQFHIAGDGKLGGIVRPNDMKCHMENGEYTHSKLLDYPSIGEINAVILQHKVYVIFAVSKQDSGSNDVFKVYNELQKHVSQSTAEQLTEDSSNVVQKIKRKYEEISKKVEISVPEKPEDVDVQISVKCSSKSGYVSQLYCTDVSVGQQIDFRIAVKLKKCPQNKPNGTEKIVVSFFELTAREKLEIYLDYACTCTSCNGERNQNPNDLTLYCNGPQFTKYISCGTCICKEGRYGESCQCSDNGQNEQGDQTNCLDKGIICSNRGDCKCGQCKCASGFNGKKCEDSTMGCQNRNSRNPDVVCSGQGECVKGTCKCNEGFKGIFCECETSREKLCIEPGKSSQICNGHGTCDCQQAQCKCNSGYGGLYCEVCKDCPSTEAKVGSRCQDEFIQKCVRCYVENRLNYNKNSTAKREQQCNEMCDSKKYKLKSKSESARDDVSFVEFWERSSVASFSDVDGTECRLKINGTPCYSIFKYAYQREDTVDSLQVYYTADGVTCAKEPPFLWYIFGVILSVLLLGIFSLLIWKLATHVHDTREFRRFEKETNNARFGQGDNPLYEKPMSEFQNPAYRD